jgi:hypothetical protein
MSSTPPTAAIEVLSAARSLLEFDDEHRVTGMHSHASNTSQLDPSRAYKVLICDLLGLKIGADGKPDVSEAKAYIETKQGVFHFGSLEDAGALAKGAIHFFYQPDLGTADELKAAAMP